MYRCDSRDVDDIGCPFVSSVRPLPGTSATAMTSVRPSLRAISRSFVERRRGAGNDVVRRQQQPQPDAPAPPISAGSAARVASQAPSAWSAVAKYSGTIASPAAAVRTVAAPWIPSAGSSTKPAARQPQTAPQVLDR